MLRSLSFRFKAPRLLSHYYHTPRRCFHPSCVSYKDEKVLKNLADSFQKGDIEPVDEKHNKSKSKNGKNSKEQEGEQDDDEDSSQSSLLPTNHIEEFESYSVMNKQQFLFQMGLDGDKPFMSFHNPHFVDSKRILRNLPDQIDVLNPEDMKRVNEVYDQLQQLDSNPALHEKFLKRYFYDYENDLMKLGQFMRGINSKFKMLRRNESEKFNPESVIHEYVNDKMKHPYNVVGFDRSFIGMPLRKEPHLPSNKPVLPREFVQDLPAFDSKITLKKFDLNFMERDGCVNVDPTFVTPLKELYDYENKNYSGGGIYSPSTSKTATAQRATHAYLTSKLGLPRFNIQIGDTEDYNRLKLNNHQITNRIEQEIRVMKKSLLEEIKTTVESSNAHLMSSDTHNDYIKSNQYILCAVKEELRGTVYIWKSFSILPVYFMLPLTKKRERHLINHLFKLFLINIEDKIDILFKIKYDRARDTQKFMKNVIKNIGHTIKFRLWRYFKTTKNSLNASSAAATISSSIQLPLLKTNFKHKQAVVYSPYKKSPFKRIYWVSRKPRGIAAASRQHRQQLRKSSSSVDYAVIGEDLLE
ncbi:hypothetical protein KGF57_002958 [Candida theae]|uniref:Uncharacterized protein n=1 Tax=Candida theae TaxID=1198502 RepID=A0AAD5BDU4_9ASCO|nr:uncharacterized protein KGF57_002958 [Candida theae]KAI5957692.1 hypothetical protein KGF57_002958 [Candida theae]